MKDLPHLRLVSRAGIEPATRRLLTTLAFTSHKKLLCCSLDWLIIHSFICLDVRHTVSEGFPFLFIIFHWTFIICHLNEK